MWKSIQHIYETPEILRSLILSKVSCLQSDNDVSTSNKLHQPGVALCLLVHQRPAQRHLRQHLHQESGQRYLQHSRDKLVTHPSQRRHRRAHDLLKDYQNWSLLQQIKTLSKPLRQHHHRFQLIVVIVVIVVRDSGRSID